MINKIEFSARNPTSNAGLLLLLEHANRNGIIDLIDHDLVFENPSTNKIKVDHNKTILCGNFIGIDRLEWLKLMQSDPMVNEFTVSIKEPETVSWFFRELQLQNDPNAERDQFQSLQKAPEKEQAQIHHHR